MREAKEKIAVYTLLISISIIFAIEKIIPPTLAIILCILFITLMLTKKQAQTKKYQPLPPSKNKTISNEEKKEPEPIFYLNESIASKLNRIGIIDHARFVAKLELIFKKHLMSINSKNIKILYNLSSKEIAESTIEMLNTYKKSGLRNKIENVEIIKSNIISVSKFNSNNTVTLEMKVKLSDYLTDKEDKVVKGNTTRAKVRKYQITFAEENQKHKKNELKCNNCGAIFDINELKCPYCRTITNNNLKPREWYIINKKVIQNTNE